MSVLERPDAPSRDRERIVLPARPGDDRGGSRGAWPDPSSDGLRLLLFAALGLFAALHWASLVASPPVGRVLLAVLLATGAGTLLTGLRRTSVRPAVRHAAAIGLVLACAALTLAALGLQVRLIWPGNWGELGSELDRGMSGIRTVVWPYGGPEPVVRLVILLGIAPLLTLAAALTFWPAGRRAGTVLRALGLIVLLVLYGIPVTDHDPGAPVARGLVLLALVAAWLWLPRLRLRAAAPGAVLVATMALVAVPVSAGLDRNGSLVDYSQWNWFGGKEISFDWSHSYGPLDWPRDGTTLLEVKSSRPLYWKAEVLDRFDGLRWNRSQTNARTSPLAEVPPNPDTRWDRSISVEVRSLSTDFVIGTGTPYRVSGAGEDVIGSADGTLRRLTEPLRRGDSYTVRTYAPTPTASELRSAPRRYDPDLTAYTTLSLPRDADSALVKTDEQQADNRPTVQMPLIGSAYDDAGAREELEASPYARAYALSRRLTAGQPTVYDAVRNVRDYFQRGFRYSERPPSSRYPLESFLFRDRIGYCQQFSGAMALLLRMSGIPARVATGFSPGSYNRDSRTYRVRDLDAHSWVEVYFAGTGWVTFDPTPPAAPAERAAGDSVSTSSDTSGAAGALADRTNDGGNRQSTPLGGGSTERGAGGGAGTGGGGMSAPAIVGGAVVVIGLAGAGVLLLLRRRRPPTAQARLDELVRALPRLGWSLPGGTTLLELERRLARAAGPESAAYVSALRAGRFAPGGRAPAMTAGQRRAVRKELTAHHGLRARLRGWAALPPTGGT